MTSSRRWLIALLAGLCPLVAAPPIALAATARRPVDARLAGTYVMSGRVLSAVRVPGEHRGQRVTRQWSFTGSACGRVFCRTLTLTRERAAHQMDRVRLRRVGSGRYAGGSRFFVALQCRGALFPRGEVAPFRITVTIARTVTVQGVRFASRLTATYLNRRRTDRTICPVGPSHDSARYTGVASPPPGPPSTSFTASMSGATDTASFSDTSAPGGDGAPITAHSWNFGDPGSGAANTSTSPTPTHAFSAPGSYQVTLTETDASGLRASQTQTVVAPGPPAAAFTATEVGSTTTFNFTDQSSAGVGGAAITAWAWDFGDPASGPANTSSSQNPQHTFFASGPHNVCLTVTDTNNRTGEHCATVTAP